MILNRTIFPSLWSNLIAKPDNFTTNDIQKLIQYKIFREKPRNQMPNWKLIDPFIQLGLRSKKVELPNIYYYSLFHLYSHSQESKKVEILYNHYDQFGKADLIIKTDLLSHYVSTFQIEKAQNWFNSMNPIKPIALNLMLRLYSQIPDIEKLKSILRPKFDVDIALAEPQDIVDETDYQSKLENYFCFALNLLKTNLFKKGSRIMANRTNEFTQLFGVDKEIVVESAYGKSRYHGMIHPCQKQYRTLIFAYANNREPLNSFQIFNWLLQSGKQVHVNHINALLYSVVDNPIKFEIFSKFFDIIEPNTVTYNLMMMNSEDDIQIKLYQRMLLQSVKPNLITQNILNHRTILAKDLMIEKPKNVWFNTETDSCHSKFDELLPNLFK
eukprot:NODE_484_length_6933_cov_0.508341.p3 type:complete len:384 gc:universal NODE_484_length_6933_cov_0.508341:2443-3594(+)